MFPTTTKKSIHKRCEQRSITERAARHRLTRLLDEANAKIRILEQENTDLRLRHSYIIEEDRSTVPRKDYMETVRQLEDIRVQHAVCLRSAILRDQPQYSVMYAPITVHAGVPPVTEPGPSTSAAPTPAKKPQTRKNRKRRERMQKQKALWHALLHPESHLQSPDTSIHAMDISKLLPSGSEDDEPE